jgi:hypothetical protein
MMERKEILKNVLIIFCVFVLFAIPWASVIGIQDPGLLETFALFQRTGAFLLLTGMVIQIDLSNPYNKSLTQEMKEEEIKETDQKDRKQLLFKPTIGGYVGFLVMILLGLSFFIVGVFHGITNSDVFWMVYWLSSRLE